VGPQRGSREPGAVQRGRARPGAPGEGSRGRRSPNRARLQGKLGNQHKQHCCANTRAVYSTHLDGGSNAAGAGAGRHLVLPLILFLAQGFSSSLSRMTATDPSRSVLPERAIIQSVDVVKGPFDPNNIEYLEKGVEWGEFKCRLR
jgi:hypothetical protein